MKFLSIHLLLGLTHWYRKVMNSDRYQVKKCFSWSKNYNNGQWTEEEHTQFITCLKQHGMDWTRLKEMIPTRTRIQIKSHSRRYFHQIKKTLGISNPMAYIQAHSCSNLLLTKPLKSSLKEEKESFKNDSFKNSNSEGATGGSSDRAKQRSNSGGSGEFSFENKREAELIKKKGQEKCIQLEQKQKGEIYKKVFKIERGGRKRAKIDERLEQRQTPDFSNTAVSCSRDILEGIKKEPNENLVMLNEDELIILGARIKTSVPCEIFKNEKGVSIVRPNCAVNITLEPAFGEKITAEKIGQASKYCQGEIKNKFYSFEQQNDLNRQMNHGRNDSFINIIYFLSQYYCYCL